MDKPYFTSDRKITGEIVKLDYRKYNLTVRELVEIGDCVLADSIRDGDTYDVQTTIMKWLLQYKQEK